MARFEKSFTAVFALLILCSMLAASCNYSFKGASPPQGIRTIYIPGIIDQSGFSAPNLGENMTVLLKNKFIKDNTLEYAEKTKADGMLTCTIKSVTDEPLVVTGNEQVSRRKITVTVSADFQNLKTSKSIWKKDFSNWGDYESTSGGFSKRDDGISAAMDKVTDDILLDVISNW